MSIRQAFGHQFLYDGKALNRIPANALLSVADWGMPSTSSLAQGRQLKEHEILVQRRFMATPAFQALGRFARARVYCAHGGKNMLAGNTGEARRCLRNAIHVAPEYPVGWTLLGLSLLGRKAFESAVMLRRLMILSRIKSKD